MKNISPLFYMLLLILGITSSCHQHNAEDQAALKKASEFHDEAFKIFEAMKPSRERIPELREAVKAQIIALETANGDSTEIQALITASNALHQQEETLSVWLENVVEPTNDHDHDHHHHDHDHDHDHAHDGDHNHDHDHHHHGETNLTPKQMLEVQEEMYKTIQTIQTQLDELIQRTSDLLAKQAS